jgi:hypothetical protein
MVMIGKGGPAFYATDAEKGTLYDTSSRAVIDWYVIRRAVVSGRMWKEHERRES